MSDLTKRLREVAGKYDEYDLHGDIELEAADRIDTLEECLRELVNDAPIVDCECFHHNKADQWHAFGMCPPEERWNKAMDKARALLDAP